MTDENVEGPKIEACTYEIGGEDLPTLLDADGDELEHGWYFELRYENFPSEKEPDGPYESKEVALAAAKWTWENVGLGKRVLH